jgi:hypothetical protein
MVNSEFRPVLDDVHPRNAANSSFIERPILIPDEVIGTLNDMHDAHSPVCLDGAP